MKAIIIGATGATGNHILKQIIDDNDFEVVEIFVRRPVSISNKKLIVNVIDFDNSSMWNKLVKGDVLFSCLGTTLKDAGSKEKQWKIDYQYQYEFAKAAKDNRVNNYVLISSSLASVNSPFYYLKMKGKLEDDIKHLNFEKTIIFQPQILERENSNRIAEVLGVKAIKILNSLGILKSQKPLQTEKLAQAIVNAFKTLKNGTYTIGKNEIMNYIDKSN